MKPEKAGNPADKRFWCPASTRAIKDGADSAICILDRIRGGRKTEFRIPVAGPILVKIAERFRDDLGKSRWTLGMVSYPREFGGERRNRNFALRIHERIGEPFQFLPSFPKTHRPLVVSAECFQAQQQVCLAALKDPAMQLGQASGTAKTIGNNGDNAFSHLQGDFINKLSPPLLRLVTGPQDWAQEMQSVTLDLPQSEKVDRVLSVALSEPDGIHNENE